MVEQGCGKGYGTVKEGYGTVKQGVRYRVRYGQGGGVRYN